MVGMTKRDMDEAIIGRLKACVARLSAAPEQTAESARRQPGLIAAHQAGALEQICRNESAVLRDLIKLMETP